MKNLKQNNLFKRNRKKLVEKLPQNSAVILLSNDNILRNGDQYYNYRQLSDFYYLTGVECHDSSLIITNNYPDKNYNEILFVKKVTEHEAIWHGENAEIDELKKISEIQNILWNDEFDLVLRDIMINSENIYLYTNEYVKLNIDYFDKNHRFILDLKRKYPLHKFNRLFPILSDLRIIKEPEEIEYIKNACEITANVFKRILKTLKPGLYEYQIEAEMNHEFINHGTPHYAFAPIIASGKNTCILHYNKNNRLFNDGELLLLDFGVEYKYYASDCSRTIPVNGKYTARQKQVYNSVLNVYKNIINKYVIGNTIDILNKETQKLIEKELKKIGLISDKDIKNQDVNKPLYQKYFMHGVSHFVGLDVHDVGSKRIPFKEGMVLTCEPGIYIKEEKIGIRLENVILITQNGPVNLMNNIPIEVEDIEKIMIN